MSGCDAFLRSNDRGGCINGIQDGFDGQALSCRFDTVKEDGGGTGEGGLRTVSGRQRDEWGNEPIGGQVSGGFGGLCMRFGPTVSMIGLLGAWKP